MGWVSPRPDSPAGLDERVVCPDILSLDYHHRGLLRPSYDIDHTSHVSFYASMPHMTALP